MATVRALKPCYCGDPCAYRDEDSPPFSYHGPKASYLELVEGEWSSTAARPQLDHDRDGREGGAVPAASAPAPAATEQAPAPVPAPAAPTPARRGRPPARRKG